ncbi:sensor histidine kinase [Streptomyces vietnamensis]|uniref:histidine kinase n=1 Tax=Streptomyces vietnamensis TaxID=362257 RepID=A0A0B5IKX4_9ACTN|nr:sensor histidine kinase [Streptomyces vietnamensis]AJF70268.1 histidine kinase [Streptomyces vietnamensis]
MFATPSAPFFKRVTPGGWAAVAWGAGMLFTALLRIRVPGQDAPEIFPGFVILRWDGLTMLAVGTLLTLCGSALLARRPTAALNYLLAAPVVASTPLGVDAIPFAQYLAVDVALYAIAAGRPRREAWRALLLALGLLVVYLAVRLLAGWSAGTTGTLAVALTALVAWLLGRSEGQAREYAERSRAQATEQAVTTERLRIAREMHDTVAHSIGIVALQAGAARRVIATQPEAARQALAEIETASRETLAGLRRMVGALRTTDPEAEAGSEADPAGTPRTTAAAGRTATATELQGLPEMPGLAALDRLAELTGNAGVRVALRRVGAPCPLPPDIDLSAFRIVQESVTNVVRHSGADSCTVTVDQRDPETLAVTVEDRGRAPGHARVSPGPGSGYGLTGMRERVAVLHGEFTAGPRPGGGFRVTARLPVPTGATTR